MDRIFGTETKHDATHIEAIVRAPKGEERSMGLDEARTSNALGKKIGQAKDAGEVTLTDDEYKFVEERFKGIRLTGSDEGYLAFIDNVLDAEELGLPNDKEAAA